MACWVSWYTTYYPDSSVSTSFFSSVPFPSRESALTYSGPVHSIDESPPSLKDCFRISADNLAYYNAAGRADFGPHNKDADGRMVLPIRVEVEKKKFGLQSEEEK